MIDASLFVTIPVLRKSDGTTAFLVDVYGATPGDLSPIGRVGDRAVLRAINRLKLDPSNFIWAEPRRRTLRWNEYRSPLRKLTEY